MVWSLPRRIISWVLATVLLLLTLAVLFSLSRFVAYQLYPYPYRELVEKTAAEYNINPLLVAAVIRTESKFDTETTSSSDARGLMQIVPETGAWAAKQIQLPEFTSDKLYEPETNLRIGIWYLNELIREFNGNLVAALAAYNGGRGNVGNWMKHGAWDGSYEQLPRVPYPETRSFVRRVLDDYRIYRWLYGTKTS